MFPGTLSFLLNTIQVDYVDEGLSLDVRECK